MITSAPGLHYALEYTSRQIGTCGKDRGHVASQQQLSQSRGAPSSPDCAKHTEVFTSTPSVSIPIPTDPSHSLEQTREPGTGRRQNGSLLCGRCFDSPEQIPQSRSKASNTTPKPPHALGREPVTFALMAQTDSTEQSTPVPTVNPAPPQAKVGAIGKPNRAHSC